MYKNIFKGIHCLDKIWKYRKNKFPTERASRSVLSRIKGCYKFYLSHKKPDRTRKGTEIQLSRYKQ